VKKKNEKKGKVVTPEKELGDDLQKWQEAISEKKRFNKSKKKVGKGEGRKKETTRGGNSNLELGTQTKGKLGRDCNKAREEGEKNKQSRKKS